MRKGKKRKEKDLFLRYIAAVSKGKHSILCRTLISTKIAEACYYRVTYPRAFTLNFHLMPRHLLKIISHPAHTLEKHNLEIARHIPQGM